MKDQTRLETLKFLLLVVAVVFLSHTHAPVEAFMVLNSMVSLVRLSDQKPTPRGGLDKPRQDEDG